MAQRNVEIVVGRLITDEAFRTRFFEDPALTLAHFTETGCELTVVEVAALRATSVSVWARAAEQIDPRLQKVSLHCDEKEEP